MRRYEHVVATLIIGFFVLSAGVLGPAPAASAQVCNVKVVTDANPDYTDIGSMTYSITGNWPTTKEKCWAIWYWNAIARRQTAPMQLHGMALTDPIRQFNDYGYTMCSTVSGVNCGIWGAMGLDVKYWDISLHTVCEVEYDGQYHMYDSSLSALYTTCDGKTIAGVTEIGADGVCAASGGKKEPGHIAKYHCLTATSPNGFLTGADTPRSVAEEYRCFNPNGLKFRYYLNDWDLGHRYILNLRDGEVYARTYRTLGDTKDYYVPNPPPNGKDPEAPNRRYRIRGNGVRTFTPELTAAALPRVAERMTNVRAIAPAGVAPAAANTPGEVVFKIEGANVITSSAIKAAFVRRTADDVCTVDVSTNNGLSWKNVWTHDKLGDAEADIKLLDEVSGAYEVLVKVTLTGAAASADAQLKSISFETVTMLNSKTQPSLKLGKNTVYVGAGEQTQSVVLWPELQGGAYKQSIVDEKNMTSLAEHQGWTGVMRAVNAKEDAWMTFRLDTPRDMTRLTFGGRFYNRAPGSHIDMLYSLDDGKTWNKPYSLTDTTSPWDVIHYEKVDVSAGKRSALVRYLIYSTAVGDTGGGAGIYAVRMEANYKPAEASLKPMEVTFKWRERQEDYSTVERSHTQLVTKTPFTYTVHVGGADHPVVESLTVNLQGARKVLQYGYSDGIDVGGEKFVSRWVSEGSVLSTGKPYTCSVPSGNNWDAGDPNGVILTDGIVGPPFSGGTAYRHGGIWAKGTQPEITVDLGAPTVCGVFRIHIGGYPIWDAIKGEVKDKVEVLTSLDGNEFVSQGLFDFNLRWKDIPANTMWNDDETFCAHNFALTPEKPVQARYVRFKATPQRMMTISEVQVLDKIAYAPFDLKLALPDGKDRSDITQYNPKHTPSQPYTRPGN